MKLAEALAVNAVLFGNDVIFPGLTTEERVTEVANQFPDAVKRLQPGESLRIERNPNDSVSLFTVIFDTSHEDVL